MRCLVATRLSRPVFLSRQECCHDALSRRDLGLVAVALTVAMVSRRLRRARQDLVCPGCFCGHGWHVGVCLRAGCALRTFWWERALADGPSGGFQKGCRACLWSLGLSGLRASGVVSVGVCHASSLSPGARQGSSPGNGRARVWSRVADSERRRKWRSSGVDQLVRLTASLCVGSGAAEVVGRSQRLASKRGGLCVPLLAACGGGLVALTVTVFHAISEFRFLVALACTVVVLSGCLVQTPDCCFGNPFLGAVRGGTVGCSGRVYGETLLLTYLFGVSRGDTLLFLPDLVEVWDVGACVVRLGSHVVAPVFRVVFGLNRVVVEVFLCSAALDWLSLLSLVREAHPPTLFRSVGGGATFGVPGGVQEVGSLH
ncbi:hypothetical protein Taro_042326 [Colocasia esculenta]|uniref:Uncharacterized protein n=1 Tax=Colocasia esculenta TaxID=4460 RepID=A0A843WGJ0_COLES|nr:hypothetical protein [Colocasia esculenta]